MNAPESPEVVDRRVRVAAVSEIPDGEARKVQAFAMPIASLKKDDFKVALALVRSIESVCALAAYAYLGLLTRDSAALIPWLAPGVIIGFPLGHWLIRQLSVETFRRVCMSFDAYLVAFGLARTLTIAGVTPLLAYQTMVVTAVVDGWLLWNYFRHAALRRSAPTIEQPLRAVA